MKYLGGKNKLRRHISTAILKAIEQRNDLFPITIECLIASTSFAMGVLEIFSTTFQKSKSI